MSSQRGVSLFILSAFVMTTSLALAAPAKTAIAEQKIALKAMRDEINRSIKKLKVGELERPFYISFGLWSGESLEVEASLGAILRSEKTPYRDHQVRVLVGSYKSNDENYMDYGVGGGRSMMRQPLRIALDSDYDAFRRTWWRATDSTYKMAAEQYERKLAALKRVNLSKE
ncbi:hypothetical protein KAI87_14865, partial [Myxococcota bacterium]|nr:hypothetical protein [Myxococcota bacterium]